MRVFKPLENNDRFNFMFSKSTNGGGRLASKKQPFKDFRLLKNRTLKRRESRLFFAFSDDFKTTLKTRFRGLSSPRKQNIIISHSRTKKP